MVKLFIGNLAESVDSSRLKTIFQPFTTVQECDVVKNYAFVHIPDDDMDKVVERLNGYILDGKQIQVKISTSKLHSQSAVGSGNCLRCASSLHRTPQCPDDPKNKLSTIKVDLTNRAATKRPGEPIMGQTEIKRSCVDDEISRPIEPELQNLYGEYISARQRYHYYRDLLLKEIGHPREPVAYSAPIAVPSNQLSAAPVQYHVPPATTYAPYTTPTVGGTAPYAAATLKAPYAPSQLIPGVNSLVAPANPYMSAGASAPSAVDSNPNAMTTQQYLQQLSQNQQQGSAIPSAVPQMYTSLTQPMSGTVSAPSAVPQPVSAPYASNVQPWMQSQPQQQLPQTSVMGNGLVKLNLS